MMIIDLSDRDSIHNMDQDIDIVQDDADQKNIPYLAKDKWKIV